MRERRVERDEVIARLQAARCAASSRAQAQGEARGVLITLGAALARVRRFAPLRIERPALLELPVAVRHDRD